MPRVDHDAFYRSALAVHGETAKGVHWNSTETQEVRFRVLRDLLPDDLSGLTLVDAGCGFGDFYCYLERRGERPGRYLGLDAMEPMVEIARRRTGCEIRILDVLNDSLPIADYYLCSGAMNNLTREESDRFIRHCYAASKTGFVFNLLKGWNTSPIYNFYLPREIKRLGQELEADCRIEEGYLAGDFTTAFIKKQAREC
ncbi:class I SAM-dependent methyltransferase [Thiocystis violascens]|uniref:Methyltransferase family protein n=1 Tax=Thiocystis violascens (strain ATCC 17096 / DSM 198 / 6111) TaxID=765911 RepID=I3Y7J3_THIV6|nr:class I SAM-dependent methyltransferase [Thiocystis violascens]AFL72961.1 methyltransferase family protein [Thiocystis violascens DSM 198]